MSKQFHLSTPEVWGGLECTINRVGNTFRDQLSYSGHYERENDIDKFAALGITSLRYPVLWEAHQRNLQDEIINWDRTNQQLEKIRSYNITPIAGLVHHGSGPEVQGLQDDFFADKLAAYAGKVAAAFPWLEHYSPVNEPLTTARFSGLYGVWYPHLYNEVSFIKMFLNQLKGIVMAMKAIRKVNSTALLIQTEDLAKIHSSPSVQYQADFENDRRWLTYDFLCGHVNRDHFFWTYFLSLGIEQRDLEFFLKNPCEPAIAGFNYYVTSERFLDTNVHAYPQISGEGNGKDRYVDIAAARALKMSGLKVLLQEAWERYHIPIALTEVHINCTREEQLRWFMEAWKACCEAKKEGIDVKAITAWALLGAFDWDSLLTRDNKVYESGVFDVSNGEPRPTAIAKMITALNDSGTYHHPVLEQRGWWHYSYPGSFNKSLRYSTTPLLIVGSDGTLGTAFTKICDRRSIAYQALSRQQVDITSSASIEQAINTYKPWAIINASGYLNIDEAENDSEACFNINTYGLATLSAVCNRHSIQLVTFSSDLVFDGEKQQPYVEADTVKPINVYGESKASGERLAMQYHASVLIIRTSTFFGPWDQANFAFHVLQTMQHEKICSIARDVIVSPTYVPHLVDKALDLLIDEEKGIWHLSNDGHFSWHTLAEEVAIRGGYAKKSIISCTQDEMYWRAKRPAFSALGSTKGIRLPSFHSALETYFNEKIF